jgi:enamine deaminase RidA (YjgF/YER057c/UK114 family)
LSGRAYSLLAVLPPFPEAVSLMVEAFNHFKVLCITIGLCITNCYKCESIINNNRLVRLYA